MNGNKIIIRYLLLILTLLVLYGCSQNKNEKIIKGYEALINSPYATHIQTVINKLNSTKELPKCSDEAISGINHVACENMLQAVRNHPQSKFFIIEGQRAIGGGMEFILTFQQPLDSAYYVWVYKQGDDSFDIRAFDKEEKNAEQIKAFIENLKKEINIEKYWL